MAMPSCTTDFNHPINQWDIWYYICSDVFQVNYLKNCTAELFQGYHKDAYRQKSQLICMKLALYMIKNLATTYKVSKNPEDPTWSNHTLNKMRIVWATCTANSPQKSNSFEWKFHNIKFCTVSKEAGMKKFYFYCKSNPLALSLKQ
jgi:hypothetical protein